MEESKWGNILLASAIGLILLSAVYKITADVLVMKGFCANCNGSYSSLVIIWFIAGIIGSFGFLLKRSKEIEEAISESRIPVDPQFLEAKKKERQKDGFIRFLDGFDKEEIEVIEFVHTYEGTSQSRLEKSIPGSGKILDKLEKKGIIAKMPDGGSGKPGSSYKLYLKQIS